MSSRDPSRPNVLFILSDDQGYWALGCAGNPEIRTPHLDALAAGGTRFTRFYCASPVCSPARASLLTGQMPSRHGVHDYLSGRHTGPEGVDFLEGRQTYTDVLADAGYRLGLSGKWHLGANDVPRRGFTHWYAHVEGGGPYHRAPMLREGRPDVSDGYLTDLLADDACDFLTEAAADDDPFGLSLHFTAPHSPWSGVHPQQWTDLYEDCAFESCPQEPVHPWVPLIDGVPIGGEPDPRAALIGYFAAVTAMDAAIGRVLERLDELGLRDSTLIVFASDNGFSCGQHGIWGKGNGTYPMNMYEESVRVPLIMAQPGVIPEGREVSDLLSAYDMAHTLLDLCGLPGLEGPSPGSSFAPLARGEGPAERRIAVVHDEYGPVRMVRSEQWKYVHRYPSGPCELYDLESDPHERENLVDVPEHGERAARMLAEMESWFDTYGDPERDGRGLPVTGGGQCDLVQPGVESFPPPRFPTGRVT